MKSEQARRYEEKVKWLQDRGYRKIKLAAGWFWALKVKRSGVKLSNFVHVNTVRDYDLEYIQADYYKFAATFKREVEKIQGKWGVE